MQLLWDLFRVHGQIGNLIYMRWIGLLQLKTKIGYS